MVLGLVSLLFVLSVPRFDAPLYTVEPMYTDHLRHEYSSWAFLHEGFDIFSSPLAEWSVSAENPHALWPPLPVIYPPGLMALFLPFGVASNVGALADPTVHMLMVIFFGVAAVAASFQLHRTLRSKYDPALAALLVVFGATLYMQWGLDGFVDPLVAGIALLGVYWADRGRHGAGLMALVTALSLHFRLWYLWPVVITLVLRGWRDMRPWQLVASGVLGAVSLGAFVLAAPAVSGLNDIPGIEPNRLALTDGASAGELAAVVAATALLVVVYVSDRDLAAVASIALLLVLVFAVDQWQAWYPILTTPVFALVRGRIAQAALVVAVLQLWLFLGGFPDVMRALQLYAAAVR